MKKIWLVYKKPYCRTTCIERIFEKDLNGHLEDIREEGRRDSYNEYVYVDVDFVVYDVLPPELIKKELKKAQSNLTYWQAYIDTLTNDMMTNEKKNEPELLS